MASRNEQEAPEADPPADVLYANELADLKDGSKYQINSLTMLAEDSKEFAVEIAGVIENQLKSANPKRKLPILYLVDSICKNYPKSLYVQLFTQNIVSNFCSVFECSGEKVRKSLHKLRMTWNQTKTFPQKKLNAIDERVHAIDPNWPVLHKLNSAPQQAQTRSQAQQPPRANSTITQPSAENNNPPANNATMKPNNKNISGGQTAPDQPKRTSRRGGKRNKFGNRQQQAVPPLPMLPTTQPQVPPALAPQPMDQQQLLPPQIFEPQQQTNIMFSQAPPLAMQQQTPTLYVPQHPQAMLPMPQLLPQIQFEQQRTNFQNIPERSPPPLKGDLDDETVDSLYGGKQCSNCSLRFEDRDKYASHLDWHFRQNLKTEHMFARRKWYYPLNLWVLFRDINDDVQENTNLDNNDTNELSAAAVDNCDEEPTAPAFKEDEKNLCPVCHEAFEKYWAEEEEEWRLKNARLHADQRVYHPLCLLDMLQASAK